MNKRQQAILGSLVRSQMYLTVYAADFASVLASPPKEDLDEFIGQIQEYRDLQTRARQLAKSETSSLHRATVALRRYMRPIADIAADHLSHLPEIASLVCPSADAAPATLILDALAMHEAVHAHKCTFVASGLDASFDTTLAAAIEDVSARVRACHRYKRQTAGATRALAGAVARALKARRTLDLLIAPIVAPKTSLRSGWDKSKHVNRARVA